MSISSLLKRNISHFTGTADLSAEKLNRINYIMASDGIWEVRKNKIGIFKARISEATINGVDDTTPLEEGVELHLPKIPRDLLNQTIAFFTELTIRSCKLEAYIQFYYDPDTEEYHAVCPKQEASAVRVSYDPPEVPPTYILVCEVHSHNSMDAFFSSTDDKDEFVRGEHFYGVIGKLHTNSPEVKMSIVVGGQKRIIVPLDSIIEEDEGEKYPAEWDTQVSEPVVAKQQILLPTVNDTKGKAHSALYRSSYDRFLASKLGEEEGDENSVEERDREFENELFSSFNIDGMLEVSDKKFVPAKNSQQKRRHRKPTTKKNSIDRLWFDD